MRKKTAAFSLENGAPWMKLFARIASESQALFL